MKARFVYFTFLLLALYSVAAYFVPDYLARNVVLLDEAMQNNQRFVSELTKAINESDKPIPKDVTLNLVSEMSLQEARYQRDIKQLLSLIKSQSMILIGLLLLHVGVLVHFLRKNKHTSQQT